MNIRGYFVDITSQVKPQYEQHTRYKDGEKVLYLLLLIEIYGCIESALFWYKLFSTNLEYFGFEINIYDRCVANKVIEGTQYTTAWYVNDNKSLHKNMQVILDIINEVEKNLGELSVVIWKKHTFLVINIEIKDNTIKVDMVEQLEDSI